MEDILDKIEGYIDRWIDENHREFWLLMIRWIDSDSIDIEFDDGCLVVEYCNGFRHVQYRVYGHDMKECIIKKIK